MVLSLVTFGLLAFALSLVLTLIAECVAPKLGVVSRPVADRWHRVPVPLMGGVGIATATTLGVLVTSHSDPDLLVLALAALAMAAVGFVDDLRALSPQLKLLVQILLAALLVHFGLGLHLTGLRLVDVLITLLWIVGVVNAMNLIDGLDGLAGGVALVAVATTFVISFQRGEPLMMLFCAALGGSILGFLFYNFNPASIFMGDTGSMFLGFILAASSLHTHQKFTSDLRSSIMRAKSTGLHTYPLAPSR